jgi:pSer/pThr/pTyr-binding forkhead associated (FHA) protein
MAKLIISDGKGNESTHELVDDVTTFGRSKINIIQIKDEQSSRQHFRIEKAGDGYRLTDLGSRNGTKVNGGKVSSQALKPGDAITVGDYKVVFDEKLEVSADELGATVAVDPGIADQLTSPSPSSGAAFGPGLENTPQFVLEITEGSGTGTKIELGVESITIGRNASNKLVIDDEGASNYHAEVCKEAIGYVVSDLGSTNGTKVNGEKIVKSPLAHGSKIKIGTTVIAFKNLGAPTEEDAVFGTVVLDSDKIDAELAAVRSSSGAGGSLLIGLVALLLIGAVGYGAYELTRRWAIPNPIEDFDSGLVANGSFSAGVDADGNPINWQMLTNHDSKVLVDTTKGKVPKVVGDTEPRKASIKFQRANTSPANSMLACEQELEGISADKAYRFSAFVQCPAAQGLYGIRLTWLGPGRSARSLSEQAWLSGAQPDWQKVKLDARPPKWANRARVSLVAIGNTGNVWFDDICFKETVKANVKTVDESVDFGGVTAHFDKAGRMTLDRAGVPALSGLIMAEGQGGLGTDLGHSRVKNGYPRPDGDRRIFRGSIYDFSRNRFFDYSITAGKGGDGVSLSYGFMTTGEEMTLGKLQLRFVIEPRFATTPEVFTAGGRKLLAKGTTENVGELILKNMKTELVLAFDRPVSIKMTPRGERKEVIVLLESEPSLGSAEKSYSLEFAKASIQTGKKITEQMAVVEGHYNKSEWKRFIDTARRFRVAFPDEKPELAKLSRMEKDLADRLAVARNSAGQALKRVRDASPVAFQVAYSEAGNTVKKLLNQWQGANADLENYLKNCMVKIEEQKIKTVAREQDAKAKVILVKAQNVMKAKMWSVAKAYLKSITTQYPGTPTSGTAKKLLKLVDDSIAREAMIEDFQDKILRKARNPELNNMFQQAIDIIQQDPNYRKYRDEMPRVKKKLAELRAKL